MRQIELEIDVRERIHAESTEDRISAVARESCVRLHQELRALLEADLPDLK